MEYRFSENRKKLIVWSIIGVICIGLLISCFRLHPDGGGGQGFTVDDDYAKRKIEQAAEDPFMIPSELGGFTVQGRHESSTYVEKLVITVKGKLEKGRAVIHVIDSDSNELFKKEIEVGKDYSNETFIIRDVGYIYSTYVDYSEDARSNLSVLEDEYAYGYQKIISWFRQ